MQQQDDHGHSQEIATHCYLEIAGRAAAIVSAIGTAYYLVIEIGLDSMLLSKLHVLCVLMETDHSASSAATECRSNNHHQHHHHHHHRCSVR